jgi:hypothetical protein
MRRRDGETERLGDLEPEGVASLDAGGRFAKTWLSQFRNPFLASKAI